MNTLNAQRAFKKFHGIEPLPVTRDWHKKEYLRTHSSPVRFSIAIAFFFALLIFIGRRYL